MKTLRNLNILAVKEWMAKNDRKIDEVSYGSKYKAWFKCSICEYEWITTVQARSKGKGCPACSNRILTENNRFDLKYPEIALEWNCKEITPDKFTSGSNFITSWKCYKCGFIWNARIIDRVKKLSNCRSCAGQIANDRNRLSILNPNSIDDWDYSKNIDLPYDYTVKSNKKVWWFCNKCKYKWFGSIVLYSKNGCPKCNGFIPNAENNLSNDNFLMQFWSDKNTIKPLEIHRRSSKKILWFCKNCNNEWKMSPHKFSSYRGCPRCSSGSKVSKKALKWLKHIDTDAIPEQPIKINNKIIYVDGLNYNKKIVYEFLGDYWHGNPKIYNPELINKRLNISYGTLYERTMERINYIRNGGFKVIYIWESEFSELEVK